MGRKNQNQDIETRQLSRAVELSTREAADGVTEIVGYAAVFDEVAHGEMIRRGAFTKTLQERPDIRAYWSHNTDLPIGRTMNGTLQLEQDAKGLRVSIRPNQKLSWGRDALEAVRSGLVTQFSFGMRIIRSSMEDRDGQQVNVLDEIALYEVSPVAEPWYEGTSAEARSQDPSLHAPEKSHAPLRLRLVIDRLNSTLKGKANDY